MELTIENKPPNALEPQRVVVVRLPARYPCERLPPRIALVVGEDAHGVRVRLWQRMAQSFATRWSKAVRVLAPGGIARDATAREACVGMAIGPVPPRLG